MNSEIWEKIESFANHLESTFDQAGSRSNLDNHYDWHNSIWDSMRFRRAHVEIVDKRESHGIYILHSTIFPHFNDPSPIWGFDAICGRNKITGAFHDFSNGGDPNHNMMNWFRDQVSLVEWSKPRELPEWARQIFSSSMIAAGNLRDINEVDMLCSVAAKSLEFYLSNVGLSQTCGADFHMAQNRYCHYQKQNPQVIKSMVAMGVPEPTILKFVDEVLFPETYKY